MHGIVDIPEALRRGQRERLRLAGAMSRRLLTACLAASALPAAGQPLARLDHIPVAVQDLDRAEADYRSLGFAIKPGGPHANGLRNAHIKFTNGAGLELISAPATPTDALAAHYVALQRAGDGPAYLTLRAADDARTAAALHAAGIPHHRDEQGLSLDDPRLAWVFFAADNRSPTDRPEHFAHANGAWATREVWVALDDTAPLMNLLSALQAPSRQEHRQHPVTADATVFDVADGGRIVIVPARHQVLPGRPIIAVSLSTRVDGPARWQPPDRTHGLWLGLEP